MQTQEIATRLKQKHALEAEWLSVPDFVPLEGELIVYTSEVAEDGSTLQLPADRITPYNYVRLKVGDGHTKLSDLKFSTNDGFGLNSTSVGFETIAAGDNSYAEGYETVAGLRGYAILDVDFSPGAGIAYLTLDSTVGLEVGDDISVPTFDEAAQGWKPNINNGNIQAVESENRIMVYLRDGQNNIYNGITVESRLAYRLSVRSKPHLGTYSISGRNHAEGRATVVTGDAAHAEGRQTTANGDFSHTEGRLTTSNAEASHAEGYRTIAEGTAAHAEGWATTASNQSAHAEGQGTIASGVMSHAEGESSTAENDAAHAEGKGTHATGQFSHTEGRGTTASGQGAHAEGAETQSTGMFTHSEGASTIAQGNYSHAEGINTKSIGERSHAEGDGTTANGKASHTEGSGTTTGHEGAHAEGVSSQALGYADHAEGLSTIAKGGASHAEGVSTEARGLYSHAEGEGTVATNRAQHVQGRYNIIDTEDRYIHIVGNGTSDTNRQNAHTIDKLGNAYFAGELNAKSLSLKDGFNFDTANIKNLTGESVEAASISTTDFKVHNDYGWELATIGSDGNASFSSVRSSITKTEKLSVGILMADGEQPREKLTIESFLATEDSAITSKGNLYLNNNFKLSADGNTIEVNNVDSSVITAGSNCQVLSNSGVAEGYNTIVAGNYSHAEGYAYAESGELLVAGMRGFKLDPTLISEDGKTFTITEGTLEGITIDDYAYISLLDDPTGGWRPGVTAYEITAISDDLKSITLSSQVMDTAGYPLTKDQTTTASGKTIDTESRLSWMLYFRDKPHLGTVGVSARAHAEGRNTKATGDSSHAEGRRTFSMGDYSHAEGRDTVALAESAHAEGTGTYAWKDSSHAEGNKTHARGAASHAEGFSSEAYGDNSHAEGNKSITTAPDSHAEGANTKANASAAHSEGRDTIVDGAASHAEGYATKVLSTASMAHAEGGLTTVSANYAHAEGNSTVASGSAAHAEGKSTTASGEYAHSEGVETVASTTASHAEGQRTSASGLAAHAEGRDTIASGDIAHAEGDKSKATQYGAHAEGITTESKGIASHSEGWETVAETSYSHSEGYKTKAKGQDGSHAEGYSSEASGQVSHAEGRNTKATGAISHAEGDATVASGVWSHSEGWGTIASGNAQHVQGKYNIEDKTLAHIVGAGTSDSDRNNIHTIDWSGNAWFGGNIKTDASIDATGKISSSNLSIKNIEGKEFASIDQDGNAQFAQLKTDAIESSKELQINNNFTIAKNGAGLDILADPTDGESWGSITIRHPMGTSFSIKQNGWSGTEFTNSYGTSSFKFVETPIVAEGLKIAKGTNGHTDGTIDFTHSNGAITGVTNVSSRSDLKLQDGAITIDADHNVTFEKPLSIDVPELEDINRKLNLLKAAVDGKQYIFESDTSTKVSKRVPLEAMQYAAIERVCGRTTKYDEVYGPDYAVYPSLIHRPLNAITIYGKNLVPPSVYNANNWTPSTTSTDWMEYRLTLPDGWFCLSLKRKDTAPNMYWYLQISKDGGTTWVTAGAGYVGYGNLGEGFIVTTDHFQNMPFWFKVDNANGVVYRLYCHTGALTGEARLKDLQRKLDGLYDIQIEAVNMPQDPVGGTHRPDKMAPPTEYTPYIEPITYTIPEEIKNLPGFGHGINDAVCNYIDFENNRYVQMCEFRSYEDSDSTRSDIITVAGTQTCAPLDKPIITPIAEYFVTLDSIFKVQPGGVIGFDFDLPVDDTFVDGPDTAIKDAAAAPSTITYQIKVPLEGWE